MASSWSILKSRLLNDAITDANPPPKHRQDDVGEQVDVMERPAPEVDTSTPYVPPEKPAKPEPGAMLTKALTDMRRDALGLNAEAIEEQLESKYKALQRLLPIEYQAMGILRDQIQQLEHAKTAVDMFQKFQKEGKPYLPFSMECMKWRNELGYPYFAMFDLMNSNQAFQIGGRFDGDNSLSFRFPGDEHLDDIIKMLIPTRNFDHWYHSIRYKWMTATFGDRVIPDDVRDKILAAKADFDQIGMLSEAEYTLNERTQIDHDPIVLGWKNDHPYVWYITDFDLSPREEAAFLQPVKLT